MAANPEREWRKMLDAHAASVVSTAIFHSSGHGVVLADDLGGLPTVEVCGPDGEWRRYYVRLTEAAQHAPLEASHLGALRQ